MKITHTTASEGWQGSEMAFFGIFEDGAWPQALLELDKQLGGELGRMAKKAEFTGASGQSFSLSPKLAKDYLRVELSGLGKAEDLLEESLLEMAGRAAAAARGSSVSKLYLSVALIEGRDARLAIYHLALGVELGDYRFTLYKKEKKERKKLEVILGTNEVQRGDAGELIARAAVVASAVVEARDLANRGANDLTPLRLADHAREYLRGSGVRVQVLNEKELVKEKMNLHLAVGSGSKNSPCLIHMVLKSKGAKSGRRVFIIGKGITFDSGGISLKPGPGMEDMKMDMSGAAAVICAIRALGKLGVDCEVHALVAAAENMPDGKSYRPGDVIASREGKTVEILNTDAEGRLTLADAVSWAQDHGATEIIDLATLTGACLIALGPNCAALFSNDEGQTQALLAAAGRAGEQFWKMPLDRRLRKQLDSDVADIKNIGTKHGGTITAALFIGDFVKKGLSWAHMDIAGPAMVGENKGHIKKGGSGFGVATLIEYLAPLG
ncbi:MAG: leucyl aminopeptidase [Planctomycetes bacterium]|nr:leucyl aminopeptidase [Planctomycetota bacterium]